LSDKYRRSNPRSRASSSTTKRCGSGSLIARSI
jgi:hypothetical protein